MRRRLVTGIVALGLLPLAACSDDPAEAYCAAVAEHRAELSEITAGGGPDALLRALDVFRDLQDRAPADITDEWQQVVGRLEALEEALDDAGVDPRTYDRANPPGDLSDVERSRIEAAAKELVAPETAAALDGLQQQARDVCKAPLSL